MTPIGDSKEIQAVIRVPLAVEDNKVVKAAGNRVEQAANKNVDQTETSKAI